MSWSEASARKANLHVGSATSRRFAAHGGAALGSSCARAALAAAAFVLVSMTLAGCEGGFKPLYGSLGNTGAADQKFAQVDIAPIPGRNGQRIRNEMIFNAYGGDAAPANPKYRLDIAILESTTSTLVTRDGASGGQIYQISASFQLVSLADKKVVLTGSSQGRAAYERYTNVFSNVRGAEDAQDRASKLVARDLKARLAAYLGAAT